MDLTSVIQNSLSPIGATRTMAEAQLKEMETHNPGAYAVMLAQVLAGEQKDPAVRASAGLILKNLFGASVKEHAHKKELEQRWMTLDLNSKLQIKQAAIVALGSQSRQAGQSAAQVTSTIALIDLPTQQWPELIPGLLQSVSTPNNLLKISSLEAIGYICEDIDPDVLGDQSNQILTAVIQGMRKEETDVQVRLAAANSLNNALVFMKRNFDSANERNFIMQTICEATVVPVTDAASRNLKLKAFTCLVTVADLYYDYLPAYVQAIGQLTFGSITADDNDQNSDIARMAIEFWCTICDEEIERIAEKDDTGEENPDRKCLGIIQAAFPSLCDLMLKKLPSMDEDLNDDEDTIQSSAGTCLTLVANAVKDSIVPVVIPFVERNINSAAWNEKASAILAFGYILEGPSDLTLQALVPAGLPVLIQSLSAPNDRVKDAAAWTLSRTCEFHASMLSAMFEPLLQALVASLSAAPRVANNACWAIHFLALACLDEDEELPPTNSLSRYFFDIMKALFTCTEREDVQEANLRISSYEVINTMISSGAQDTIPLTTQLIESLLIRLANTFQMEVMSGEDKEEQSELQGLICGVLTAITQKLGANIKPFVPRMMTLFLQVFNQQSASLHEEALMSVSAVASNIGAEFGPYAPQVYPFLLKGLQNHQEYEVCTVAVGLVGDLSRALGKSFAPFTTDIVGTLLTNLQNENLDNSVKPAIIAVFGDIAMSIQELFEPILAQVMYMLYQASMLEIDTSDEDMVEYRSELRVAVLDSYIGILQGFHDGHKLDSLVPFLDSVFNFIATVAGDADRGDEVTRLASAVVGDSLTYLGPHCVKYIQNQAIQMLVREAAETGMDEGKYAAQALSKSTSSQGKGL
eukprot:c12256_g1_i1.p1 GENE.c12256_g1_i1~~c12256_g1_i1.p1  ORF type:complete len:866 (-),score=247.12 c12256_g1_i1:326-2923(-)